MLILLLSFVIASLIVFGISYQRNKNKLSLKDIIWNTIGLRSDDSMLAILAITIAISMIVSIIACITSVSSWNCPENNVYPIERFDNAYNRLYYKTDDGQTYSISMEDTNDYTVIVIPDILENEQNIHVVSSTSDYDGSESLFFTERYNRSDTIFIVKRHAEAIKDKYKKEWLEP